VLAGKTPSGVLTAMGIQPDFIANRPIRYIHRVMDDKDVYFIASADQQSVEAVCTFRVSGKSPEAWHPETGRMEPISVFEESDGCTRIPLRFEPSGSMFIVFKKGKVKASEQIVSVKRNGQELVNLSMAGSTVENSDVTNTFTMVAWIKPDVEITIPQETNEGLVAYGIDRNDVVFAPPGHEVWNNEDAGAGFGAGRNGVCVF